MTETKPPKYRTTTKKRYVESKGGAQSFGSHSGDLDSTAVSNSFPKLNISLGGPDVIFVTSKIAASGSSCRNSKQRYLLQPPQKVTLK